MATATSFGLTASAYFTNEALTPLNLSNAMVPRPGCARDSGHGLDGSAVGQPVQLEPETNGGPSGKPRVFVPKLDLSKVASFQPWNRAMRVKQPKHAIGSKRPAVCKVPIRRPNANSVDANTLSPASSGGPTPSGGCGFGSCFRPIYIHQYEGAEQAFSSRRSLVQQPPYLYDPITLAQI